MKKISFLMAALLVAMVGCQKEPAANDAATAEGKVYMTLTIQAPTTKSETNTPDNGDYGTSTDGTEPGTTEENAINNVHVYLQNQTTLTFLHTEANPNGSGDYWWAEFSKETSLTNGEYKVYVVCNDTKKEGLTLDQVCTLDEDNLTSVPQDGFIMTNAKVATSLNITADQIANARNPESPINLGVIDVERSVARFDYKVADPTNKLNDGTYQVKLTHAQLINMSKAFYYFRRVSADGTSTNAVIGGAEMGAINDNYVVDTDFTAKNGEWADEQALNFMYHMSGTLNNWTDLTFSGADSDNYGNKEYKIWRYATENTIPGAVANQVHGRSTGIIFKGILYNGDTPVTSTEDVYVFDNKYLGTWANVKQSTDAKVKAAADMVGETVSDKKDAVAAGFTVYSPNTSGQVEMLYYYWNRHNDNNDPYNMGVMEFAVVRNNVYKLAVTSIAKYGHPTDENGDPDPVDPKDPDESQNYYFEVAVKVLPWTVRINNIEF